MKRKEFIRNSAIAAVGLSLLSGCESDSNSVVSDGPESEVPPFPYVEVSGSNYEIGKKIGEHFKPIFEEFFRLNEAMIQNLLGLAESEPEKYYNPFYNAAIENFPQYVDELKGMADGSGIPFKTFMCFNLVMEIMIRYNVGNPGAPIDAFRFGCSDISYSSVGKTIMAHNEDFFASMNDLMYVAKVSVPGKPTFVGLNYPGLIIGIAPGMNEAGLVQTGNFISLLQVADGIPWAFLARSILDHQNLSDAVASLESPLSSYSQHYQIGSFTENKITAVEFAAGNYEHKNLNGFYVHTNHLILPEMKDLPQAPDGTTFQRYDILSAYADEYKDKIDQVDSDKMISWLSNHDGYPDYVCAHGLTKTVSSSVFNFQDKSWRLYKGNPCYGYYKTIRI
ncbi:MAG: hypothetical protein GXO87_12505 [Chlorobi bacterium]|nr:hypothetical protein [Chlorobiota bacterium]